MRGKYVSLEFDSHIHPEKLSQLVKVDAIRHEQVNEGNLPIDNMSRAEILFSQELVQWVTTILLSPEAEHDR